MPKKKKTRKQKMAADLRNKTTGQTVYTLPTQQTTNPVLQQKSEPAIRTQNQNILTSEYTYLNTDLIKTAVLTISIIIAELLLQFTIFRR